MTALLPGCIPGSQPGTPSRNGLPQPRPYVYRGNKPDRVTLPTGERVLAHLALHPGLTTTELARVLRITTSTGRPNGWSVNQALRRLEAKGKVVCDTEPCPWTPTGVRNLWRLADG